MNHDDTNPPAPADTTEPATETPAAKRERTTYPIRLQRECDGGFAAPAGPSFNTIDQAERWILAEGEAGVTYEMARVIGFRRRPKPVLEEVTL